MKNSIEGQAIHILIVTGSETTVDHSIEFDNNILFWFYVNVNIECAVLLRKLLSKIATFLP